MIEVQIPAGKKAYFASDFHLGFPIHAESLVREKYIVAWLTQVQKDASDIFLLGDLFDFWFEYNQVVPKGFVRFLGKLAEMYDAGIRIHIFVGNHDLWMKTYLKDEIGAIIYTQPTEFCFNFQEKSVRALLGHGDGLGPGDNGYKFLKKIFVHPLSIFLFKILHPDLGVRLAHLWSNTRKSDTISAGDVPFDSDSDFILNYVRDQVRLDVKSNVLKKAYVFGHRHHPIAFALGDESTYYNLGDWFSPNFKNAFYLVLADEEVTFKHSSIS
jgi:UDP-2,3-diacylglucosamine hydrolase